MKTYVVTAGTAAALGAGASAVFTGHVEVFAWAALLLFLVYVLLAAGRAKRARS